MKILMQKLNTPFEQFNNVWASVAPLLKPSIQTPLRISRGVNLALTPYTLGIQFAQGIAEVADTYVEASKKAIEQYSSFVHTKS